MSIRVDQRPQDVVVTEAGNVFARTKHGQVQFVKRYEDQQAEAAAKLKEAGVALDVPIYHSATLKPDAGNVPARERAWWRPAAALLATGMTEQQVANTVGVGRERLVAVMKSPPFQALQIAFLSDRVGGTDVVQLIREAAKDSFFVLRGILTNEKAPLSLKEKVASGFMDRAYGKAKQSIEIDATVRSENPVAEAEALRQEIRAQRMGLGLPVDGVAAPAVIAEGETGSGCAASTVVDDSPTAFDEAVEAEQQDTGDSCSSEQAQRADATPSRLDEKASALLDSI